MDSSFIEFITGLLGAPLIQDGYNSLKSLFVKEDSFESKDEIEYQMITDFSEYKDHLNEHLKEVNEWSKEASLNHNFKPLSQIYVHLKFYLNPRRTHHVSEDASKIEITSLLFLDKHIVIYGGPGSGKSTSMKFLCQQIFTLPNLMAGYRIPVVIRFRELNPKWGESWTIKKSISKKILDEFGVRIIDNKKGGLVENDFDEFQRTAIRLLNTLNAILILDGYDEVSSLDQKSFYSDEIRKFAINLDSASFFVTSRTGDFNIELENTLKYEIAALSHNQIKEFIANWLQNENQAKDLFNQIVNSPFYDTAVRPLTLSQLCSIYDKSPNKQIPEKPKSVYSLVVQLLLREWNDSRGVNKISKYASFEIDRKELFLYNLAYLLSVKYNVIKFDKALLKEVYKTLSPIFSLPATEVDIVLDELESHNGLFVQSGYETYEFSHLSLQEFLTAKYVVSLGGIPTSQLVIEKIPAALAIATVISANQTEFFYNLVFSSLLKIKITAQLISSFLNRLAIEKPDFSLTPIVAISLLTLLDKNVRIINKENSGDGERNFKSLSELEDSYGSLFDIPMVFNSFKDINKYYKWKENTYVSKFNIEDYFIILTRYNQLKDDFTNYTILNEIIVPKFAETVLYHTVQQLKA